MVIIPTNGPKRAFILARKKQKIRRCCQSTLGKSGNRLISNLYVGGGVTQNSESWLSYCPDNDFFQILLDESGLFPYSGKKWSSVVIRGLQECKRGRNCSEVVAASIWMPKGAWRSPLATGLISSSVVTAVWC